MNPPEIIVGVDGSPASHAALQWAATEAVRRSSELVVVHVYEWRVIGARVQMGGAHADDARAHAEALVESAVADARSFAPGVNVRGETVQGSAGPILVGASKNAGMVVVGSRGRGGFTSLLLGSVSQQVATHASGPVVVVRGRTDVAGGPIVVGVDGSTSANHALGVALEEALARETGVVAVRAYTPAKPPWGSGVAPHVENWEERKAYEHQILLDDIAQWTDKYPNLSVEKVVAAGNPSEVLTDVSSKAQLVVVGSRGHGGFTGLLLGSVGLQLLHHAESPVLIARDSGATPN